MTSYIVNYVVLLAVILPGINCDCIKLTLNGTRNDAYNDEYTQVSRCNNYIAYQSASSRVYLYHWETKWFIYHLLCVDNVTRYSSIRYSGVSWEERDVWTGLWVDNNDITIDCLEQDYYNSDDDIHIPTPDIDTELSYYSLPRWWLKILFYVFLLLTLCFFAHKNRRRVFQFCYNESVPESALAPAEERGNTGGNTHNDMLYHSVQRSNSDNTAHNVQYIPEAPAYIDHDDVISAAPPSYTDVTNDVNNTLYVSPDPPDYQAATQVTHNDHPT